MLITYLFTYLPLSDVGYRFRSRTDTGTGSVVINLIYSEQLQIHEGNNILDCAYACARLYSQRP